MFSLFIVWAGCRDNSPALRLESTTVMAFARVVGGLSLFWRRIHCNPHEHWQIYKARRWWRHARSDHRSAADYRAHTHTAIVTRPHYENLSKLRLHNFAEFEFWRIVKKREANDGCPNLTWIGLVIMIMWTFLIGINVTLHVTFPYYLFLLTPLHFLRDNTYLIAILL